MTRIILLGYMGAGKTTVGRELAKRLNLRFYDLDWYIETRFCKKVSDIFAAETEEGQGETIYLKGTPEILFQHLLMAKGKRPLLEGKSPDEIKEYIKSSLETREPFYSKAKHIYNIELLGNGEKIKSCVEDICHMLNIP